MKFAALLILWIANSAYAGEVFDERAVVKFDGREWVAAHASATEQEIIVEYVLKGEQSQNWSELFTAILVPMAPNSKVTTFMRDFYHDKTLRSCPETNWEEIYSSDSAIICLWDQESCFDPDKTEYSIVGFVTGISAVHIVTYAARNKQVFEKRMPVWRELIKQVTFFNPDESKKDLQPNLLTDTTKMIHMVYRFESPSAPKNSFWRSPRKFWRSGWAFFRSEEQTDTINNLHTLVITSSPDVWVMNLLDSTGNHIVDPGPDYGTICPVFGEMRDDGLRSLEFGKERAFFEYHGARKLSDEIVNSKDCEVYELPRLYWILRMYVRKDTGMPYKISRRGPDGSTMAVYFDQYYPTLDFDSALFWPQKMSSSNRIDLRLPGIAG